MDINELKKKYAALIDQAKAKAKPYEQGDGMPKEIADEINGLLGQADEIKVQIDMAERIAAGDAYLDEPAGTKAAHHGFRLSGPGEGDTEIDVKSWRSFEIPFLTQFGIQKKEFRYHVPLVVQKPGYKGALEAYMRHGRERLGPNDRKALAEALDSTGGYWVYEDIQASVLKKIATMATVRNFARVISTSSNMVSWPRIKYTTDNKYTSGVRLTWTGETPTSAAVHRVTDQVAGELNIPVHTAMASQLLSFDLLADAAFDVEGISTELFGEAFALGENAVFWTGSGAGQPRGIITDASDTTYWDAAMTDAATADTIDPDEVIDVCYALPAQYERNARWFFTKATEKYIRKLKDADSDYLWERGFEGTPNNILGFPYVRDEFMHNISDSDNTTTYPLIFGDLNGYIVVDRVGLSIQRLDEIYAETNQALLLGKKRVGGQLVEAYRLSLLKTVNST